MTFHFLQHWKCALHVVGLTTVTVENPAIAVGKPLWEIPLTSLLYMWQRSLVINSTDLVH